MRGGEIYAVSVGFPGVGALLEHLKAVAGVRRLTPGEYPSVPEGATVIFGAWHPSYRDLLFFGPPRRRGILWTSSAGEMELNGQGVEIAQLSRILRWLENGTLDFLLCTDPKLARCFDHPRVGHLPCPVAPELVRPRGAEKVDGIGLFCPAKPSKNVFPQLLAVRLFQRRHPGFRLHTNLRSHAGVIEQLGIDAEIHGWMPRRQYLELLESMRVNLQVELCGDYFNYQAVEAGLLGVPSVVGPGAEYSARLRVPNSEDPESIVRMMELALHANPRKVRKEVVKLAEYNNVEVVRVLETIK